MKKILAGLVIFGQLLSQFSCTKVLYSHEQVMQSYMTKEDVLRQFGPPDEKVIGTEVPEEWLYACDSASVFNKSKTKVKMNGVYNPSAHVDTLHTHTVQNFTAYINYIRFAFDAKGIVIKYETYGMDFVQRKTDALKTTLLVIGCVAVFFVAAAIIYENSWSGFYIPAGTTF
jgi:hypothetical protein